MTNPKHAACFRLVSPAERLPKGIVQASPPLVQSIRVTRRAAPDGRVLFDLVGEVTQSCTVERKGELFDVAGGCTVVIDPEGTVRYSIFKRLDSEDRHARQLAAMRGPLKRFWRKTGRKFQLQPHVLRRLHAGIRSIQSFELFARALEVHSCDGIHVSVRPSAVTHHRHRHFVSDERQNGVTVCAGRHIDRVARARQASPIR